MTQPRNLTIGAVSYLNTKPLVYELESGLPDCKLVFDLPSRLAQGLAEGQYDVALIPSIEVLGDPRYVVVSDACIGCRGPVWSVKLLSRVPPHEIKTLALDVGSRTSAALAQILLWHQFQIRPQLLPLPIDQSFETVAADAVVVIGDRAMNRDGKVDWVEEWDLGDRWCRWTELPFVFAMWTARSSAVLDGLDEVLEKARDAGLEHSSQIAKDEAGKYGLSQQKCEEYFLENLHFRLGSREREGLLLYLKYAAQLGLAPSDVEIKYHDCKTT